MMISFIFDFSFFKQKTAYEVRISDLSSDVCSSDLVEGAVADASFRRARSAFARPYGGSGGARILARLSGSGRARAEARRKGCGAVHLEIGRAACRERVCQYVLFS